MSTLDKIIRLLNEKGLKQKDLTDYLQISKGAFTDWKSGRMNSYQKHIPKIAEFLGVSSDYLLGIEENPKEKDWQMIMKTMLFDGEDVEIDEELLLEVKRFAQFCIQMRNEKNKKSNGVQKNEKNE